jgi:hypothetical protein
MNRKPTFRGGLLVIEAGIAGSSGIPPVEPGKCGGAFQVD